MTEDKYITDDQEEDHGERIENALVYAALKDINHVVHCLVVSKKHEELGEILGYAKAVAVEAKVFDSETGHPYESKIKQWRQYVGIADRQHVTTEEAIEDFSNVGGFIGWWY